MRVLLACLVCLCLTPHPASPFLPTSLPLLSIVPLGIQTPVPGYNAWLAKTKHLEAQASQLLQVSIYRFVSIASPHPSLGLSQHVSRMPVMMHIHIVGVPATVNCICASVGAGTKCQTL